MYRLIIFCLLSFASLCNLNAQLKVSLPATINSSSVETRPLISPSGKIFYFSRREHPDNMGGKKDDQDIWMADFSLDSLEPNVQNLGKLVNTKKLDALVSVSANNQELIIYNNKDFNKAPLLRLKMSDGGWSKPEPIVIKDFYNLSTYSDFYYSFSQKVILMALKRAESRGGQDLFVSFQVSENVWSEPISLGGVVNTRKDDFAPFLAADGKSLFYCSYGLKGEGKADIYYSYRLDDTWTNWSAPINLGKGINSKNEEIYVSVSPDFEYIYFDSYSPEDKDRNVYKSTLPQQFWPKEDINIDSLALTQIEPETAEIKTEETVIEAPVIETTTQVLPEKRSYSRNEFILLQPSEELPESPAPQNKKKIGRNIYFEPNRTIVRGNLKEQFSPILAMLHSQPNISIELEGHTDSRGTRESNIAVSYQRAQVIKKYLVKEGISPERIKLSWKGDTEPLATNDDEKDGRELNRRVEVFVLY